MRIKSILAALLAVVISAGAFCVPAFAYTGEDSEPTVQDAVPGRREDRRFGLELQLRGAVRADGQAAGGLKAEANLGERAQAFVSIRNTLSEPSLGAPTLSAAYYGKRALGQLIVGHFNARFGQGLLQWSGFQLSGFGTLGAFRKNGTGFSPTGSHGATLLGVATDWHFGTWEVSAAYSLAGNQPIVNVTKTWRTATAGLTATREGASLEARFARPDWSLFAETAVHYDGKVSALAGAFYLPAYGHRIGVMGRWYGRQDKRYSGAAAGYEGPAFGVTADAGWRTDTGESQFKALLRWHPEYTWRRIRFLPEMRLQGRLRPKDELPLRVEGRAVLGAEWGPWLLAGRFDAVWCRGFAWNWYAEGGWKREKVALYVRGGLFRVDARPRALRARLERLPLRRLATQPPPQPLAAPGDGPVPLEQERKRRPDGGPALLSLSIIIRHARPDRASHSAGMTFSIEILWDPLIRTTASRTGCAARCSFSASALGNQASSPGSAARAFWNSSPTRQAGIPASRSCSTIFLCSSSDSAPSSRMSPSRASLRAASTWLKFSSAARIDEGLAL